MTTIIQLVISGLLVGGLYALVSTGLTLTYGVLRIVNFAHGEFVLIGMYATLVINSRFGIDPYVAAPVVFLITVAISAVVYWLIMRHTIREAHAVQAFVTLGLALVITNLTLIIWGARVQTVRSFLGIETISIFGIAIGKAHLVSFFAAMVITGVVWIWIQRSDFGRGVRATTQSRDVASLMGIRVGRVYFATFAVGTGLAGLAGALLAPIFPIFPRAGFQLVLIAFVVVVLGGMGSIVGATLGGLLIGLVEAFSAFYLGTSSRQIVYFLLFVLILVLRPSGLMGIKGADEIGYREDR